MGDTAYSIWRNVGRREGPELASYTQLSLQDRIQRYDTSTGKALKEGLPLITFNVDSFEGLLERDSLWGGMPYLVFSSKLRTLLEKTGVDNLQYFPAEIKNRQTNEVLHDYKIANIVGLAACLDRTRSSYEPDPQLEGRIKKLNSLVIDASKVPENLYVFRLEELPAIIICHQRVSAALSGHITGVDFVEPESFSAGW